MAVNYSGRDRRDDVFDLHDDVLRNVVFPRPASMAQGQEFTRTRVIGGEVVVDLVEIDGIYQVPPK
jgi:hypothetical protein